MADRVPERISKLVYIDAFVPGDGQAVFDLISPRRRPAMEALVASEGFGWLLPRYAGPPWEQVARQAWQVADEADLRWMLPRLRPTPGFDRYAQTASQDPHWRLFHLAGSHLPYITSPHELAPVLLELAAS